ncbi:hypothetical protein [Nocardia sp. NPDC004860]|uniref:hypothetical protein n=1 Tax=Nocardia sp. NPDC004860 TaxID=3154557 RepID=UPI0033A1B00C
MNTVVLHPAFADHHGRSSLSALAEMVAAIISWLRAGYPDYAPLTGHSPLLALYGRRQPPVTPAESFHSTN